MHRNDEQWQTFDWDGREIAWRRVGQGPPLVLCHGTPFSSEVWTDLVARVAADHTVHLWDMPGYGRSSKAAHHAVDLGVQGRALAALLDHWQLRDPVVVAHDIGGATALRAHLLHGCDYSTLVLVDAVVLRPWGSDFFRLVRDHAEVFAALPEAMHRGLVEAYVRGAVHGSLDDATLAGIVDPWLGARGRAAFYAQIAQADEQWTVEVEDLLPHVRCPTAVVWGAEDAWLPVEHAHRLAAALGAPAPTVVPGAGHLVQVDAVDDLVHAVRHRARPPRDR
ncbi:alpha/beta hydrolase [Nocardioides panacisoli]|uniref:alpha/beta fold hydrolase n=1 Tax=Nocardioides panacisoli TaxID=627624 RepID=UPI001C630047|nr:alpha/beta hydrolase [Nocardioides panacisoli]QYJ02607.1 alpha/beta hydrolase [Nocardioides panacisoli]